MYTIYYYYYYYYYFIYLLLTILLKYIPSIISVNLTYYKAEKWVPKVSWIPNKHYSGVYGLLKLILPDAMREDKVLVFDTDVTVLNDVSLLWHIFEKFSSDQALGLTENQSHWYIKALSYGQRPWPALGRGFNTGVMLMHLQQLRKRKFTSLWEAVTKRVLAHIPETSLADQDIINAVIKERPFIVYKIKCTWNIQLSDHTISDICYRDTSQISVRFFVLKIYFHFSIFFNEFFFYRIIFCRSFIGILLANKMYIISILTNFASYIEFSSRWTGIYYVDAYLVVINTKLCLK